RQRDQPRQPSTRRGLVPFARNTVRVCRAGYLHERRNRGLAAPATRGVHLRTLALFVRKSAVGPRRKRVGVQASIGCRRRGRLRLPKQSLDGLIAVAVARGVHKVLLPGTINRRFLALAIGPQHSSETEWTRVLNHGCKTLRDFCFSQPLFDSQPAFDIVADQFPSAGQLT